ncbi:TonB-dependent receptor [Phocaeicola sp. Sa1CVN1]|uniref:TonB-dependent receptor n=1 Tax=Phocaeicola intestinalis TaxID=2762212 RepID=A0ABR8Y9Y8_9BACT|nr:TonB-dependent receptor [Phocaeicola intestinalis]MBD8041023.1 TonB-dependent receptor [Phocaeicola intestinalis]
MRKWIVTFFLLAASMAWAQDDSELRQIYMQAEEEYTIGHFDASIRLLNENIAGFDGALKTSAYRLLSLCYLGKDHVQDAEKYASLLLKEDPYYSTSIHDPLRFADMIERLKRGEETTITTASQQAESIEEAPVPVTLITEEMIKAIGARTLKDVLLAYVPGITSVESSNEVNVAMHGVYSGGQEKILIMLNGQRMNARVTNKAAPDYSISLEKVKQIEVLRGPASSLYGNVALMAVVNLITKDGSEINGVEASVGFGNFKQKKGSILFGTRFINMDFMAWGTIYASDGQKRFVAAEKSVGPNPHDGYAWTEAYNRLPSYDFGFNFKWWKLSLSFNQRYGKKVPVYADVYTSMGSLYDYNKYRVIDGEGPGHGMSFTHAGLLYSDKFNNCSFNIEAYFDLNKSNLYSIIGDEVEGNATDGSVYYSALQIMKWSEFSIGGTATLNYSYPQIGHLGKGNILAGLQMEYMRLYGTEGLLGSDYTNITTYWPTDAFRLGGESTYSPFIQLKHYFNEKLILNSGVRYDIKRRVNKKMKSSISPRVSFIYLPNKKINLKLNYGRSFVDAPYFYRYNQSPSYQGPEDMEPEYMEAIQVSFNYQPIPGLSYNGVLFYNNLEGLIYRDNAAKSDEPHYINGGKLKVFGIENVLEYQRPRFRANFNMTYQSALSGENYNLSGHQIYNVPNWFMNATLSGNLVHKTDHKFWLYANGRLIGKQLSPIDNIQIGGNTVVDMNYQLPIVFTMNLGARYYFHNVELELTTYNLFDKTYYQGGSTLVPYIQQGFSILGTVRYILKKKK